MRLLSFAFLSTVLFATACTAGNEPILEGDLPFEDNVEGVGKADHLSLEITRIFPAIEQDRLVSGGKAIITSAESWEDYMGTEAPDDVDFDREWVAFFGAGVRNTGGYSAQILSVQSLQGWGGLVLETKATSPGFDCIVTQAITFPHTVVKFEIPEPTPTWAVSDHSDEVVKCGPTNEDRLADLADSLETWEDAKLNKGDSYHYSREFQSFSGFSSETDFVIEDGVVVERHFKSQHISGGEATTWSEIGDEVGTHEQGHRVATMDDLYEECKTDVLTQDEDENFINLSFDVNGLLQSCTYFPRFCADDCQRGPVITDFAFTGGN